MIVRIARARIVRRDHRRRRREHQVEPIEEELVHVREVARMLVRRPLSRRRATLQDRRRNLAHERNDEVGSALERVDDGC